MKNNIEDVRNHMFAQLEELADLDGKKPEHIKQIIDKAKAVASLGTVIVNSAKIEVEFYKAGGMRESKFITKGLDVKKLD